MSELGDSWRELKAAGKKKRWQNYENAVKVLTEKRVPFKVINSRQAHLYLDIDVDYWPTTGSWQQRKTQKKGRGLKSLLRFWHSHAS